MPWWGWLLIGIFLMAAELTAIDVGFYLLFVGFAAACVGLLGLFGLELPVWGQYLVFAAIAGVSIVLFRDKLYKRIRGVGEDVRDSLIDQWVLVEEDVAPGHSGRVAAGGSHWTAYNASNQVIPAESHARVIKTDGIVLHIVEAAETVRNKHA